MRRQSFLITGLLMGLAAAALTQHVHGQGGRAASETAGADALVEALDLRLQRAFGLLVHSKLEQFDDAYEKADSVRSYRVLQEALRFSRGSDEAASRYGRALNGRLAQFHGAGLPITEPAAPARAVSVSADGSMLAMALQDESVVLCNLADSGVAPHIMRLAHEVNGLAFSPDGALLAASGSGTIGLVDVRTRTVRETIAPLKEGRSVVSVAFSPDSSRLICSLEDGFKVCELSAKPVTQTRYSQGITFDARPLSADGKRVVCIGATRSLQLWDLNDANPSGRLIAVPGPFAGATASSLATSANGTVLAGNFTPGFTLIWSASNLDAPVAGIQGAVSGLTFGGGDERLVIGLGSEVKLVDLQGRVLSRRLMPVGDVRTLDVSRDGKVCVALSSFGVPYGWKLAGAEEPVRKWSASSSPNIAVSGDSQLLATSLEGGGVQVWDLGTGRAAGGPIIGEGTCFDLAFHPTKPQIAVASGDKGVAVWDVKSRESRGTFASGKEAIKSLAYSPDGAVIVLGRGDGTAILVSGESLQVEAEWHAHRDELISEITQVRFSKDPSIFATGGWDGNVKLWKRSAPPELLKTFRVGVVNSIDFSPSGKTLAVAAGNIVSFWNVEQDVVAVQPISMSGIARAVRYSPDGTALAIGSDSGQVTLYDPRTLIRLSAPFQHPHFINDLEFAGEETLFTGCWDSAVRQFKLGGAADEVEQALAAIFQRGPLPASVLSTIEVQGDAGDGEFTKKLRAWKESRRPAGGKP